MKIIVEPGILGAASQMGMGETPAGEQVFAFVGDARKVLLVFKPDAAGVDELTQLCCMMGAAALVLKARREQSASPHRITPAEHARIAHAAREEAEERLARSADHRTTIEDVRANESKDRGES